MRTASRDVSTVVKAFSSWAQFGGWHGKRAPHFSRRWGYNVSCHTTFFSLGFVFGEVSKI